MRLRQLIVACAGIVGVGALALAIYALVLWQQERAGLRRLVADITATADRDIDRVTALNRWVYRNKGFEKNQHYFLHRRFGPTPGQVLRYGGQCNDKSRLLAVMLREGGYDSTLMMLSACEDCKPGHTVALTRLDGRWTPLDPTYDLAFPASDGTLHDVRTVRSEPTIVDRRLAELVRERGPADKIARYDMANGYYTFAETVNWQKNRLTEMAAALVGRAGVEPRFMPRPLWLDDPHMLVAGAGAGVSLLAFAVAGLAARGPRRAAGGPRGSR